MSKNEDAKKTSRNVPPTPSQNIIGSGNVVGSGNTVGAQSFGSGNATGHINISKDAQPAMQQLFDQLQNLTQAIEDRFEREQAQSAVNGLQDELAKGDQADEKTLEKRLSNLKTLFGDGFAVAITTIANPAAGFALIARKVAERSMSK